MKKTNNTRIISIAAIVLAVAAAFGWSQRGEEASGSGNGADPVLPFAAMAGKAPYDANCATCHGRNGTGTDKGPPFMHAVYNPGHHSDLSFARAVQQGVRQHHWRFGDMPAQPQVTPEQLEAIVRYVRAVQESGGITYEPHKM